MNRFVLFVMLFSALPTYAQKESSKERLFSASREQLYAAAVNVAKNHYTLVAAIKDEGVVTYQTGYSLTSNGFQVTVTFEDQSDGKTLMRIRPAKKQQLFAWGAGDRIAKKFFGQVSEELAHASDSPTASPSR